MFSAQHQAARKIRNDNFRSSQVREIHHSRIRKSPLLLGEGFYGEVWLATLATTNNSDRNSIKVSLKMVKNSHMSKTEHDNEINAIRTETDILSYVGDNDYILKLIGIMTENPENICMVTDYCEFGSLDTFLAGKSRTNRFIDEIVRRHHGTFVTDELSTTPYMAQGLQGWSSAFNERRCKGYATTSDLIAFGYQIASGMKFLNRKNIFLQELVLHNILLKRNFIIQIADFGLSRLAKSGLNGFDAFSQPFPTVHNAVQSVIRVTKLESNWRSLCALLWELFQMGTTKFNFSCQSDGSREFQELDLAPLETQRLLKSLWNAALEEQITISDVKHVFKLQLISSCPELAKELIFSENRKRAFEGEQMRFKDITDEIDGYESPSSSQRLIASQNGFNSNQIRRVDAIDRQLELPNRRMKDHKIIDRHRRLYEKRLCCAIATISVLLVLAIGSFLIFLFAESENRFLPLTGSSAALSNNTKFDAHSESKDTALIRSVPSTSKGAEILSTNSAQNISKRCIGSVCQNEANCYSNLLWSTSNGNILLNGEPFVLKGINYHLNLSTSTTKHNRFSFDKLELFLDFALENHFNAIRFPISIILVLNNPISLDTDCSLNSINCKASYMDILDAVLDRCASKGLLLLLFDNRHHIANGVKPLWYDGVGNSEGRILQGWDVLMTRLAMKWNLFGVDLANELGTATWGMGKDSDWNTAAERLIQYMATNHPTFAGFFFVQGVGSNGMKNSSFPNKYQGGILQGVHSHPISTGLSDIDRRVIYSPHVFGPDYAEEAHFRASNFPMNMPQIWNEHFGFVTAETGQPVIMGAWGGRYEPGTSDEQYQNQMAHYLIENCMTNNFYWSVNGKWAFDPFQKQQFVSDTNRETQKAQLRLLELIQPRPNRIVYSQMERKICVSSGSLPMRSCKQRNSNNR